MVEHLKRVEIHSINFNQTHELVAIGTSQGFQVYTLDPLEIKIDKKWYEGVRWIQLVGNSNIILLIPKEAPFDGKNRVLLWDAASEIVIGKIKCQHPIDQISYTNNVCIIPHRDFTSCVCINNKFIYKIDTAPNEKGIHAASLNTKPDQYGVVRYCVAVPHTEKGEAAIQWFSRDTETQKTLLAGKIILNVNQSGIAFLSLNVDGSLLAVASEKGTLIRLYNTQENKLLYEFRRGSIPANISYLAFDLDSKYLVCTSDRSKVHVYKVSNENTYHSLYYLKYLLTVAGSQWSAFQYQLDPLDTLAGSRAILANDNLIVATFNGKIVKAPLNQTGGLLAHNVLHELQSLQS